MTQEETTSDGKYFTVYGLKQHLQRKEQEFIRMSKEITSLLDVYDSLTIEEIRTRFYQLSMVPPQKTPTQKPKASKARRESICWGKIWNKLKFWKIRTSKKSEKK